MRLERSPKVDTITMRVNGPRKTMSGEVHYKPGGGRRSMPAPIIRRPMTVPMFPREFNFPTTDAGSGKAYARALDTGMNAPTTTEMTARPARKRGKLLTPERSVPITRRAIRDFRVMSAPTSSKA